MPLNINWRENFKHHPAIRAVKKLFENLDTIRFVKNENTQMHKNIKIKLSVCRLFEMCE